MDRLSAGVPAGSGVWCTHYNVSVWTVFDAGGNSCLTPTLHWERSATEHRNDVDVTPANYPRTGPLLGMSRWKLRSGVCNPIGRLPRWDFRLAARSG